MNVGSVGDCDSAKPFGLFTLKRCWWVLVFSSCKIIYGLIWCTGANFPDTCTYLYFVILPSLNTTSGGSGTRCTGTLRSSSSRSSRRPSSSRSSRRPSSSRSSSTASTWPTDGRFLRTTCTASRGTSRDTESSEFQLFDLRLVGLLARVGELLTVRLYTQAASVSSLDGRFWLSVCPGCCSPRPSDVQPAQLQHGWLPNTVSPESHQEDFCFP